MMREWVETCDYVLCNRKSCVFVFVFFLKQREGHILEDLFVLAELRAFLLQQIKCVYFCKKKKKNLLKQLTAV